VLLAALAASSIAPRRTSAQAPAHDKRRITLERAIQVALDRNYDLRRSQYQGALLRAGPG